MTMEDQSKGGMLDHVDGEEKERAQVASRSSGKRKTRSDEAEMA